MGLHVVGGSDNRRVSLVAVADLVECLLLAAEYGERLVPGVTGHGIYFAAAEDVSYIELGMAIARALGKPEPRILHLPGWSMRTIGHFGDVMSRLRRRLGWIGTDKFCEVLAGSWTCCTLWWRRRCDRLSALASFARLLGLCALFRRPRHRCRWRDVGFCGGRRDGLSGLL